MNEICAHVLMVLSRALHFQTNICRIRIVHFQLWFSAQKKCISRGQNVIEDERQRWNRLDSLFALEIFHHHEFGESVIAHFLKTIFAARNFVTKRLYGFIDDLTPDTRIMQNIPESFRHLDWWQTGVA